MKVMYKRLLLNSIIILNFSMYAFLPTLRTTVTQQGPIFARQVYPVVQRIAVRKFSTPAAKEVFTKFFTQTQTGKTLETLYKTPEDYKIFKSILLQRLALNTSAAFGATHMLNTGLLTSTILYGTAFAHAARGSLREYAQFLQHTALKRSIDELRTALSETGSGLKNQLTRTENNLQKQLQTLEKSAVENFETVRATVGETKSALELQIQSTGRTLEQQVRGTESLLAKQMEKLHHISSRAIEKNQETLDSIATVLNLTRQDLQAVINGQRALSDDQKKLLNVIINTLTTEQRNALGRINPL